MGQSLIDNPNPERRWQNMRRMAWLCVGAGLMYPLFALLVDVADLVAVAPFFYLFATSIVGAYMGFSTWGDKA